MQKWRLHEALPKSQFENIIVLFAMVYLNYIEQGYNPRYQMCFYDYETINHTNFVILDTIKNSLI